MNTINNNVSINLDIIKTLITRIIEETNGIVDIDKLLFKTIGSKDNVNNIIIEQMDNNILNIEFSISIYNGNLIIKIPESLQQIIYKEIKYYFGLDSIINIQVNAVISKS
jgi:uncharacterized alkaline shock family protein YloU